MISHPTTWLPEPGDVLVAAGTPLVMTAARTARRRTWLLTEIARTERDLASTTETIEVLRRRGRSIENAVARAERQRDELAGLRIQLDSAQRVAGDLAVMLLERAGPGAAARWRHALTHDPA